MGADPQGLLYRSGESDHAPAGRLHKDDHAPAGWLPVVNGMYASDPPGWLAAALSCSPMLLCSTRNRLSTAKSIARSACSWKIAW